MVLILGGGGEEREIMVYKFERRGKLWFYGRKYKKGSGEKFSKKNCRGKINFCPTLSFPHGYYTYEIHTHIIHTHTHLVALENLYSHTCAERESGEFSNTAKPFRTSYYTQIINKHTLFILASDLF